MAAALTRNPVTVQVDGRDIAVPYRTAGEWLAALSDSQPSLCLVRLTDETNRAWLLSRLAEGTLDLEAAARGSYDALEQVGGRRWWETYRLALLGVEDPLLGHLVLAGVDPYARGLGEWCAAVYTLATRNAKPEDQFKLDAQLAAPPPGYEDEWETEEDFAAMVAAARNMPGMR